MQQRFSGPCTSRRRVGLVLQLSGPPHPIEDGRSSIVVQDLPGIQRVYIYIYIYIYTHTYIYIYIYVYGFIRRIQK